LGARKLVASGNEKGIDSFESVEKRSTLAAQQESDKVLAKSLQKEINESEASSTTSSGRIAAMLAEEENSKTSIYRTTGSSNSSNGNGLGSNSPYRNTSSGSSKRGNSSTAVGGPESFLAREKYKNVKGISSDAFFGRDEEDNQLAKSRLEKYSGSSAISSDMLYKGSVGDYQPSNISGSGGSGHYGSGKNNDNSLDKLKDSVSGFFDDIQKRIG